MTTFTALTTLVGRDPAERLGVAMERLDPAPLGVGVFEIEDGSGRWEVGGYFDAAPDETGLMLLANAFRARPFTISELPETDWVAKVRRELAPISAGRFFLYGAHDADKVPDDAIALLIEASMAFGTGHHATTRGCLLAFDALLSEGSVPGSVVDIGCGTAVLAMAAAKSGAARVVASDIDPVAVEVAAANVAANGLAGDVVCVEAAGTDHPEIRRHAPFDLVFANILMGPLVALAGPIAEVTAPEGAVILSGILNEQADDVAAAYREIGFNIRRRDEIVDWTTLTLGIGHN